VRNVFFNRRDRSLEERALIEMPCPMWYISRKRLQEKQGGGEKTKIDSPHRRKSGGKGIMQLRERVESRSPRGNLLGDRGGGKRKGVSLCS